MTENTNSQNQIYFPIVGGADSSSKYGIRKHPITGIESEHKGIDYKAPEGTPVVAIKSGTITRIGWQSDDHSKGFGQRISIKYDDGSVYEGFYGHLSGFADGLKAKFDSGETVKVNAGQVIGYVGSTGGSTGPHLHYEEAKFVNGKKVETNDPTSELSKATILNKDGTKIPVENSGGIFTTVIDFFSSTATSISDFFKNFNSEVEGIINLNPFVTAKVGNPNFLIGFNQESSYTVRSGDNLSKIATDNNTTVDKILEANPNIENPDLISIGDSIVIPKIVEQHSFNLFGGNSDVQVADSGMIGRDFSFVDGDGNPTSVEAAFFKTKDANGKDMTFVREGTKVQTKDGEFTPVSSILKVIDSATSSLIGFINHQIEGVFEPIFRELFSTEDSTKDANGDNAALRLTGKILADLLEGKDITDIAQDQVNSVLIQNLLKDASAKLASVIPTGPLGADAAKFVQGTVSGAIINFAIAVAADRRMDSDEYGEVVAKDLISAANDNFSLCKYRVNFKFMRASHA